MFGAVMFAIGIYSIVNLQRFGVFTGSTYTPGAAIFIVAGVLKFGFGIMGILVVFWQKKALMAVVSCVCVCVSVNLSSLFEAS